MKRVKGVFWAGVLGAWSAVSLSGCADTPDQNSPPDAPSSPAYTPTYSAPSAAPQADERSDAGAVIPSLLSPDAPRQTIVYWLQRYAPASRGQTVYINGDEAFWIEHQDIDPRDDLKISATIHVENFADPELIWRSSYQVTQFDCDSQQQYHFYLTRYPGTGLTGEPDKETQLIRHSDFVTPTSLDFAHLRAACLPVYDQIRKRPYTLLMPR